MNARDINGMNMRLPTQRQSSCQQAISPYISVRRTNRRGRFQCQASAATATKGLIKESAGASYQGTARKRNEDRYALEVCRA